MAKATKPAEAPEVTEEVVVEVNPFAITEETSTDEEGQGSKPSPGIHFGVELLEVKYNTPDPNAKKKAKWDESLSFKFGFTKTNIDRDDKGNVISNNGKQVIISKKGDTITHTEFYSVSRTDNEKVQKIMSRVRHIMLKFMEPSEAVVSGSNFKEIAEGVVAKLSEKKEGVLVKLKVITNNNNGKAYASVPYYQPFIEANDLVPTNLIISEREKEGEGSTSADALDMLGGDSNIIIPGV